jgi:Circadian oscillating protein COP23
MRNAFFQKLIATVLLAVGTATTLTPPSRAQNNSGVRFYCGTSNGERATIVKTATQGEVPLIIWAYPGFGSEFTPEKRCQIVSQRFQSYYEEGTLDYVTAERIRGYDTVCVARSQGGRCEGRILFTLPPGRNANDAIEQIFNFSGPYRNNCGVSQASRNNGKVYIDIRSFIQNRSNPNCNKKAS